MEEFRKTMEESQKKYDEQIKAILKPEQVARLNQLRVQQKDWAPSIVKKSRRNWASAKSRSARLRQLPRHAMPAAVPQLV